MATCEVCGYQYDQTFELWLGGETEILDNVERAFYDVAPRCEQCDRRIFGRGIETGGIFFCCVHCAREYERAGLQQQRYQYASEISRTFDKAIC